MAATHCVQVCRHSQNSQTEHQNGEKKRFDFNVVVGVRQVGLRISEIACLLAFAYTCVSQVYREWPEKRENA